MHPGLPDSHYLTPEVTCPVKTAQSVLKKILDAAGEFFLQQPRLLMGHSQAGHPSHIWPGPGRYHRRHAESLALTQSMAQFGPGPAAPALMYTCSGCGISFDTKRGLDAHRSHRHASPMCRGGFDRAQRLSLAVTSRDFRVRGRLGQANRTVPAEDAG